MVKDLKLTPGNQGVPSGPSSDPRSESHRVPQLNLPANPERTHVPGPRPARNSDNINPVSAPVPSHTPRPPVDHATHIPANPVYRVEGSRVTRHSRVGSEEWSEGHLDSELDIYGPSIDEKSAVFHSCHSFTALSGSTSNSDSAFISLPAFHSNHHLPLSHSNHHLDVNSVSPRQSTSESPPDTQSSMSADDSANPEVPTEYVARITSVDEGRRVALELANTIAALKQEKEDVETRLRSFMDSYQSKRDAEREEQLDGKIDQLSKETRGYHAEGQSALKLLQDQLAKMEKDLQQSAKEKEEMISEREREHGVHAAEKAALNSEIASLRAELLKSKNETEERLAKQESSIKEIKVELACQKDYAKLVSNDNASLVKRREDEYRQRKAVEKQRASVTAELQEQREKYLKLDRWAADELRKMGDEMQDSADAYERDHHGWTAERAAFEANIAANKSHVMIRLLQESIANTTAEHEHQLDLVAKGQDDLAKSHSDLALHNEQQSREIAVLKLAEANRTAEETQAKEKAEKLKAEAVKQKEFNRKVSSELSLIQSQVDSTQNFLTINVIGLIFERHSPTPVNAAEIQLLLRMIIECVRDDLTVLVGLQRSNHPSPFYAYRTRPGLDIKLHAACLSVKTQAIDKLTKGNATYMKVILVKGREQMVETLSPYQAFFDSDRESFDSIVALAFEPENALQELLNSAAHPASPSLEKVQNAIKMPNIRSELKIPFLAVLPCVDATTPFSVRYDTAWSRVVAASSTLVQWFKNQEKIAGPQVDEDGFRTVGRK